MAGDLGTTRRALHGVAELVLAGPEYRISETIRLRPVPGGFGTLRAPALKVENGNLVGSHGSVPIHGHSCAELAASAGVDVGAPANLYHDGSGVDPGEMLTIDNSSLQQIVDGFGMGEAALRQFAPDIPPVLWPEHFDMSITVDTVNYGISPGDSYLGEPYAYVGPPDKRADPFFNAPFGAARALREIGGVPELVAYFIEGNRIVSA